MSDSAAFDGSSYVADTSAWARSVRRAAADEWSQAMLAGQLWMTPVVKLELLYSTRDEAEFAQLEGRLDDLREAQLDRSVVRAAVAALRELAAVGPLHHRVPITDALIAAAAAERGVGVLHYDEHFDRLAAVLGFESRWIVVRGRA
ncbi:MAG: PIN domain-containing protein [Solirubrobacteraceae bacterium]